MESKSFKNLSSTYKTFLKDMKENDVLEFDDTMDFPTLKKIYDRVARYAERNDVSVLDLNHIINNYTRDDNKMVNLLKEFISFYNYSLIKVAVTSSKWNKFLTSMSGKLRSTDEITKEVVLQLLNKYVDTWNIITNIIVLSKSLKVKEINIDDPEDIEFMVNLIKINY